jgi:hypothetical protein
MKERTTNQATARMGLQLEAPEPAGGVGDAGGKTWRRAGTCQRPDRSVGQPLRLRLQTVAGKRVGSSSRLARAALYSALFISARLSPRSALAIAGSRGGGSPSRAARERSSVRPSPFFQSSMSCAAPVMCRDDSIDELPVARGKDPGAADGVRGMAGVLSWLCTSGE